MVCEGVFGEQNGYASQKYVKYRPTALMKVGRAMCDMLINVQDFFDCYNWFEFCEPKAAE